MKNLLLTHRFRGAGIYGEIFDIPMSRNDFREVGSGQIHVPDEISTPTIQKQVNSSSLEVIQNRQPIKRKANEPLPKTKKKKKQKPTASALIENEEPAVCLFTNYRRSKLSRNWSIRTFQRK